MIAIIINFIKPLAVIIGASILLFMIVRYYGIWNSLIYAPLIAVICFIIYGGTYAILILSLGGWGIFAIYYLVIYIIKYFVDKNPPVNNSRSNNRSNNTRTSITNY